MEGATHLIILDCIMIESQPVIKAIVVSKLSSLLKLGMAYTPLFLEQICPMNHTIYDIFGDELAVS